ncbi:nose resistant to fluoxetine protein 6-like [Dermacentor andersoni]|uniref:nose resistant to fluoxetine protein 6-like n=1 Tax=Dermacentor andersoni TaxID=34620 RepID=UPI003B3B1F9D
MNLHLTARVLFLCAALSSLVGFTSAVAGVETTTTTTTTTAPSPTRRLEADFAAVTKVLASKFLPSVSDLVTSPDLSVACSASVVKLLLGLKNKDAWAMKMLLSNGFLPSNIFEGGQVNIGSYEQCLHTRLVNSEGRKTTQGQYCSLHVRMPVDLMGSLVDSFHKIGELLGRKNPLTRTTHNKFASTDYRIGICTPSTCTAEDLQVLATKMLGQYGINSTVRSCRTDAPKAITKLQAASMAVLGGLALTVIVATLAEWIMEARGACNAKPKDGTMLGTLLYFSAISNTRYLLRTENTDKNRPLLFLGGFKVLLILWVIYGHAYIMVQLEFSGNLFNIENISRKVVSQIIPNGFLSVSTFLYLSGFALTFSLLGFRQGLYKQNLLIVFLIGCCKRYIRLTIPIIGVILCTFLLPLLVDGPADQDFVASEVQGCISKWWTVFLHFNNFNSMNDMCLQHLWYVSADMQLFLFVALPLTLIFVRHPKIGLVLSASLAIAFTVMTAYQIYHWNVTYSMTVATNDQRKVYRSLELIYYKPFTHVGTYVVGLVAGYLALEYRNKPIHKVIQTVHWLLSIGLACFVMFVTVYWNQGNVPNKAANALYGGCHRLLWALSLAWPSFACATGRGGVLEGFLSWKALRPLSRLTYCIYLVHLLFFLIRMGNMKTNFELDEYMQLMMSLGIFCYSAFFGYLLYLCFEAPAFHLQRILFKMPTSSKPSQRKSDDLSTTEVDIEKASSESSNNNHGNCKKKSAIDNAGFLPDAEKSHL